MNNPTTPDGTRRIGRGMAFAAWILAAALLTWLFSGLLEWQRNPNRDVQTRVAQGVREVVLERNRFGHYVANGQINHQPVEFLLDTGATDVVVPISVARRLGLKPGAPQTVQTASGRITAYAAKLDSVKLGEIELTGVAATINPRVDIDGVLLGMSFLEHLELIQRGNTLTIRQ